jgi:adenine deaminase
MRRAVLGLAEMMNFPGVISGTTPSSRSSCSRAEHRRVAPGVLGKALQAYAAAGIRPTTRC